MSMLSTMTARRPDVHNAVRETYRRAMLHHQTAPEAFDLALAVLLRRLPLAPGNARRVVAVMLANEPSVPGALSFKAPGDGTVIRPARRGGRNTNGSAR